MNLSAEHIFSYHTVTLSRKTRGKHCTGGRCRSSAKYRLREDLQPIHAAEFRSQITNGGGGVVSRRAISHLLVAIARSYRARGYRVTRIKRRPRTYSRGCEHHPIRPAASVHLSIKSDHNYTPYSDTVGIRPAKAYPLSRELSGASLAALDLRNFVYTP